jgi:hypothetical protein
VAGCGWGNNERQTNRSGTLNFSAEGTLKIETREEVGGYTSGKIALWTRANFTTSASRRA